MNRFCFFCGEGYDKQGWSGQFECSCCEATFDIPVAIKESQITLEEAEAKFNAIPLTDNQKGHTSRKRKRN